MDFEIPHYFAISERERLLKPLLEASSNVLIRISWSFIMIVGNNTNDRSYSQQIPPSCSVVDGVALLPWTREE